MINLIILLGGDLISMLGSSLTSFAFGIWLFQQSNSASSFAIGLLLFHLPKLFVLPVWGALLDGLNRKHLIIGINILALILSAYLTIESFGSGITVGLIYFSQSVFGIVSVVLEVSFSAIIPTMVQRHHLTKANGVVSLVESLSLTLSPAISGFLYSLIGLKGLILVDCASFLVGILSIIWIPVVSPARQMSGSIRSRLNRVMFDVRDGFHFIFKRQKLFFLQVLFAFANLLIGMSLTAITSLILLKTGNDSMALGTVRSAIGIGGVVGSLLLVYIPRTANLVKGIFLGLIGIAIGGWMIIGSGNGLFAWCLGSFLSMFFLVYANALNQTIWQTEVPTEHLGKVFGARSWIAQCLQPLGFIFSGILCDKIFEPYFMTKKESLFSNLIGSWLGYRSGTGSAFLINSLALLLICVTIIGWYCHRQLKDSDSAQFGDS